MEGKRLNRPPIIPTLIGMSYSQRSIIEWIIKINVSTIKIMLIKLNWALKSDQRMRVAGISI